MIKLRLIVQLLGTEYGHIHVLLGLQEGPLIDNGVIIVASLVENGRFISALPLN